MSRSLADTDTHEVTVRGLSSDGAGVADLPDGRVVFIPRTAPGDLVEVRLTKSKKRWARAELARVVAAGPERVQAPCRLYDRCGGCALQHLPYQAQLEWKSRFIADALRRIGGIEIELPEVAPSPSELGYRNRVTYTLRRLAGGRTVAGFHALGRPTHVVDVHGECLLPAEPLRVAWAALRASWGTGARLLPEGGRLRLTLRTSPTTPDSGVLLLVEGGEAGWSATELGEALPDLASIWHRPAGRKGAARVHTAAGVGTAPAMAGAFAQVNTGAADALRAHVLELGEPASTVVDAYCGAGAYGRPLAEAGKAVVGIESDPEACDLARLDAPEGFEVLEGAVEALLSDALPADLLILNPPRTGLDEAVSEVVREQPPERILYVSCDPATLARDLARFAPDFVLTRLRAFDLFPQTAHVETVVELSRAANAPPGGSS